MYTLCHFNFRIFQMQCCSCLSTGPRSSNIVVTRVLERRATWSLWEKALSATSCNMRALKRFWTRVAIALCRLPRAHLKNCQQLARVQVANRPARARTQRMSAQAPRSKSQRLLQALQIQTEKSTRWQVQRRPVQCFNQFSWTQGLQC